MSNCRKPCTACPFRVDSAPGWLGASTPIEFMEQAEAEIVMPCHLTIDYTDENWRFNQLEYAPQCAGRANYMANRFKQARNKELIVGEKDGNIFSNTQEFVNHHTLVGEPPKILIVGSRIIIQG